MSKIKVGDQIKPFTLPDQNNKPYTISRKPGKPLVIYFYPKDDTPGCTKEACMFRDAYEDFLEAGAEVVGISSDSPESHRQFAKKYRLPFTLLSDPNETVRKEFGVRPDFLGLLAGRTTYIIDPQGVVRHIFNSQFNIKGHIDKALAVIRRQQAGLMTSNTRAVS